MDILTFDFSILLTWENLFAIIIGILLGLFLGAMPGIGSVLGVALIIPFTFTMSPVAAILLLVSIYQGAEYGNSISSIVMGVPGGHSAIVTLFDGNTMAKQGFPGKALGYSLTASLVGGVVGALVLMFFAIPLSALAMNFTEPEIFLIGVLALILIGSIGTKDLPKSTISILLGLLLSTVGMDVLTGTTRFTYGSLNLMEGFNFITIAMGLFALTEVLNMLSTDLNKRQVTESKNLKTAITWKEFLGVKKYIIQGSIIGTIIGILPGMGSGTASMVAYSNAKKSSNHPERFGKGEPGGIAAPEAANNAAVGGALVPLLTLGIPGSASTAIIISAFMVQGIQPGPQLFQTHFDLVAAIFWGFLIATISMYFIGKYTTSLWARLLTMPNYALVPIILLLSLIGAYTSSGNSFDLWVFLIAGVIAFLLKKLHYSEISFIMAFIIGPFIEEKFRRSLMLSNGDYSIFYTRGYCIVLLILIFVVIGSTIYRRNSELITKETTSNISKN